MPVGIVLFSLALSLAAAQEPAMPQPALVSLDPPVLLPDGSEFKTWQPVLEFSRTYYVDGSAGSDENAGTKEAPFKTIQRAAMVLEPGERAIVAAGVYREWVQPRRGGTGPDKMISYQAAPGADVVIRGSRVVTEKWTSLSSLRGVWALKIEARWFRHGYNPFLIPNITPEQFEPMDWAHGWRGKKPYTLPRGLVFQDGRRLRQVNERDDLAREAGTYWVALETGGPAILVRPFGDADPNRATMEITTQQCVFAPGETGLGYIHAKGFTIEHAGNPFPFPQYGALSTWRGHHWLIEHNTVRQANGVGIDIGDQFWGLPQPKTKPAWHIVRRNAVTDCGVCGIQGLAATHCLVEENLLCNNAFHPVEQYWETGAIKLHCNNGTLIRRNRIFDTHHGCGIWMDFANVNSRCTQNLVVGSRTVHGGIFLEASLRPNLIDRNVIWDTQGAGLYEHDSRGQTFAHNFIGRSSGPAILLRGKVTDRKVHGEPVGNGGHVAVNNVFFANKEGISTKCEQADVSHNLSDGVVASFDRESLTLTWHVTGPAPWCQALAPITHDFFGRVWPPDTRLPGPFRDVPSKPTALRLFGPEAAAP
ncbi:MAG TPA: right-handed parallel beta-helix repeat-containing protein [Planctomycetota bacterium]|nr:right-handed parallel beta-helix repeat-containing protein [Planctomycetota bacterium]HRR81473.1 right-handed parallel beta-helix repeat-containing protein [Planctomycetota bacterium]HRT93750.1 right-handed parallel beta-helix repeat-containing protein [Planctomycetota bacterium]